MMQGACILKFYTLPYTKIKRNVFRNYPSDCPYSKEALNILTQLNLHLLVRGYFLVFESKGIMQPMYLESSKKS